MNPQQILNLRMIQILLLAQVLTGVFTRFGRDLHLSRALHHDLILVHLIDAGALVFLIGVHLFMVLGYSKNRGVVWGMIKGHVHRDVARRVWPWWSHSADEQ